MKHTWKTGHMEETQNLALVLAKTLNGGEIITLRGDLGAGKTTFTQGLAKGLGIDRPVKSPTFTIIREYQGKELKLNHMDLYRIEDQFEELGLEEYFNQREGVTVIEWPEQMEAQIPMEQLSLAITLDSEGSRNIAATATGERYKALLMNWINYSQGGDSE